MLEKVREALKAELGDFDYDATAAALGEEFADEEKAARGRTLSDEHVNTHVAYCINEEGHLAVVAAVFQAGQNKIRFIGLGL